MYGEIFNIVEHSTILYTPFFSIDSECSSFFMVSRVPLGFFRFSKMNFDDTFHFRSIGRQGVEWIFLLPRICITSFTIHFSFPLNETDWLWELDPSSSVSCHVVPCNWYPLFDKISGWFDLIPIRFEYPNREDPPYFGIPLPVRLW